MVREAIGAEHLILAGATIGNNSVIEVKNYYIQSGDLLDIQELQEHINEI